mgnify:CR=1 FL=1
MKMASLVILMPPAIVLIGTAVAVLAEGGKAGIANPGAHGFSEILYAFSSAGNNNGSAFAGLSANTPFYNTALGLAMLFARYWLAIPVSPSRARSPRRRRCRPARARCRPTRRCSPGSWWAWWSSSARSPSSPRSRWDRSPNISPWWWPND